MSGATTAVVGAAVVGAGAAVYQAHAAASTQKKASNAEAANTKAVLDQANAANNVADAKAPNVQGMNSANVSAALSGGSTSTDLTHGVDPNTLALGRNTLLGA